MGGDVGIVSILRGVGAGNEERVDGMAVALLVANRDAVGFGFVSQAVDEGFLYVGGGAAATGFGELHADEGVEAHPAGAKEGTAVDGAVVEAGDGGGVDDLHCRYGIHGDLQVARQPIAAAAGDDGQCGFGADERTGNFVDGAVAAHCHHDVDAAGGGFAGDLGAVSGIFGVANLGREAIAVEMALNGFHGVRFVTVAGDGIDDE